MNQLYHTLKNLTKEHMNLTKTVVNERDYNGWTPLITAIVHGIDHIKILEDSSETENSTLPIEEVDQAQKEQKTVSILKMLLDLGADPFLATRDGK